MSTMVLVLIVAILSMVAVPNWIQAERNATLSSAADELASARMALQRSAAEDTGATLIVNGPLVTITGNVRSTNMRGGADWTGHLPDDATVSINDVKLGCISLGGSETPVISPTCSVMPLQAATSANPSSPMVWSAQVDGHTETLPE
jgi:type II secretory pathway pseudopilin PulG